jgi:hypothetical protein
LTTQASNYDESNWYVTVDVDQVRTKIVPLLTTQKGAKVKLSIKKHLPQEVEQISFYGHSEAEDDLSVVVTGDFDSFEVNEYINSLMYLVEDKEDLSVIMFDSNAHNGSLIEQYKITGDNESKSFYSAKISNDKIVLGFDKNEIKNWIDNKYSSSELKNTGLVSVLVNIESAMAHMGADLKSNKQAFNSAVFQKITRFSASVFDIGENLAIESALSTADEATAKQLEQVLNGLIAMNALSNLSDDNPLLSALASSLTISNHGSELLLSTEFALSLIPEFDVD